MLVILANDFFFSVAYLHLILNKKTNNCADSLTEWELMQFISCGSAGADESEESWREIQPASVATSEVAIDSSVLVTQLHPVFKHWYCNDNHYIGMKLEILKLLQVSQTGHNLWMLNI